MAEKADKTIADLKLLVEDAMKRVEQEQPEQRENPTRPFLTQGEIIASIFIKTAQINGFRPSEAVLGAIIAICDIYSEYASQRNPAIQLAAIHEIVDEIFNNLPSIRARFGR